MGYRLAIFDFDGTIADSAPWFLSVFNDIAARHRFRTVNDNEIAMLRGHGSRDIMRYLGIPRWRLPFIAADLRRRMALADIPLFPGIGEALDRLNGAGITCAIVSSNSQANILRILGKHTGSISVFECGAGLFGKHRRFRAVLRRTRIPPDQTICIGDEQRDIEAAKAIGAASAAVLWGYATPEILIASAPTAVLAVPEEIAGVVCGQNPDADTAKPYPARRL